MSCEIARTCRLPSGPGDDRTVRFGVRTVEFFEDELFEEINDVFERQFGGVDFGGILGADERAIGPCGVKMISAQDLVKEFVSADVLPLFSELVCAPLCSDLGRSVEVELCVGIREDDGSLISPFGDESGSLLCDESLLADHVVSEAADGGDERNHAGHVCIPDSVHDGSSGAEHCWGVGVPIEVKVFLGHGLDDCVGLIGIEAEVECDGGGGPVHGAGVKEFKSESDGERSSDGGFAGSGGAVDGDDDPLTLGKNRARGGGSLFRLHSECGFEGHACVVDALDGVAVASVVDCECSGVSDGGDGFGECSEVVGWVFNSCVGFFEADGGGGECRGVGCESFEVVNGVLILCRSFEVGEGADAESADLLDEVGEPIGIAGQTLSGGEEEVDFKSFGGTEDPLESFDGVIELVFVIIAFDANSGGVAAEAVGGLDDAHHAIDRFVSAILVEFGEGEFSGFDEDEAWALRFVGGVSQFVEGGEVSACEEICRDVETEESEVLPGEPWEVNEGQLAVNEAWFQRSCCERQEHGRVTVAEVCGFCQGGGDLGNRVRYSSGIG